MKAKDYKGKAKVETGFSKMASFSPKKRILTPPKARADPAKKSKKEATAAAVVPTEDSIGIEKAEAGPTQSRPSP